jgi:hypothetical protein
VEKIVSACNWGGEEVKTRNYRLVGPKLFFFASSATWKLTHGNEPTYQCQRSRRLMDWLLPHCRVQSGKRLFFIVTHRSSISSEIPIKEKTGD